MLNAACLKLYRGTEYKHFGTVAAAVSHCRPTVGEELTSHRASRAVDAVVTDTLKVVSQVRDRVVDWAAQQVLAVVKFGEPHSFSLRLASSSPRRTLRKS